MSSVSSAEKPRKAFMLADFLEAIDASEDGTCHGVVHKGPSGAPNDHYWPTGADHVAQLTAHVSGYEAYVTVGAYRRAAVGRFNGRKAANVTKLKALVLDIDAGPEKLAKHGEDEVYADGDSALQAVKAFISATGLKPNFITDTLSGGLHLWYVLDEALTVDRWEPLAKGLVARCRRHGLKIDAPCTPDAARVMRAPGSMRDGAEVIGHRGRDKPYTTEEMVRLLGPDLHAVSEPVGLNAGTARPMRGINAEALEGHAPTPYSYMQAAEKCGAMASAMQRGGRDVAYPVWLLALATAKHAIEGEVFAHQISEGHADYDEAETDAKLKGLNGGPSGCEAWAGAYGPNGPCNRCEFKGQLKNPAVQLGKMVDVAPAVVSEGEPAAAIPGTPQPQVPQWVAQMNERYALVRVGGKIQAADFFTPSVGAHGVTYGLGFLDLAALRATHAGQYAPIEKVGQKAQPLVQAWLTHKQRRAYEGLAFAPGETLPSDMLNLWTGFAAQPQAGDVSPWLELLDALIPDSQTRAYVLRWFAWKVQNPGGVPGTGLILTGPKGSGKNSLAEIVMGLFGAHGMLAADPEMIAGRFTIHLMDKALVVVDEAVFSGDAASMDRLKARVTGTTLSYEGKGLDPVTGVNRAAYVMLTNHTHVWQSSVDERRAVVCEVSGGLCGQFDFWARYHAWVKGPGPGALLHYLQGFDLSGFNVRAIPKTEALRKQTELTALRDPVVVWWHQVLSEGALCGSGLTRRLSEDEDTEIPADALRGSYEASAGARAGRYAPPWPVAAKRLAVWLGPDGLRKVRARSGTARETRYLLPPLGHLREIFSSATHVAVDGTGA